MRKYNLEGLVLDRIWFRDLNGGEELRRDSVKLELAAAYVRRNWWWTPRVKVFTDEIDAALDELLRK